MEESEEENSSDDRARDIYSRVMQEKKEEEKGLDQNIFAR